MISEQRYINAKENAIEQLVLETEKLCKLLQRPKPKDEIVFDDDGNPSHPASDLEADINNANARVSALALAVTALRGGTL